MLLSNHRECLRCQMRCQGQEKDSFFFFLQVERMLRTASEPCQVTFLGKPGPALPLGVWSTSPGCLPSLGGPWSWSTGGRARWPSPPWGLGSKREKLVEKREAPRRKGRKERRVGGRLGEQGWREERGGPVGRWEAEARHTRASRKKHDGSLRHGPRKLGNDQNCRC